MKQAQSGRPTWQALCIRPPVMSARASCERMRTLRWPGVCPGRREHDHLVGDPINGDDATGTWYLLDCTMHGTGNPLQVLGIYDEEYRRVDGTWKIARLTLRFKWSGEVGRITAGNPMEVLGQARRSRSADGRQDT
jgi:SnoaL-like domain